MLYVSNLLCASSQIKHVSDGSIIFIDIICDRLVDFELLGAHPIRTSFSVANIISDCFENGFGAYTDFHICIFEE
ncbi:hypothetical protein [uncultured Methanobrevibacter sp.]|uniref:hypothetical protein n=1 Tax=uncultured Methanobrevibacter sp. TaxID=253161 RepID=UPI0025935423|nr:hypothetical protein [uncultured Methanobrevibacter sp.]